MRDFAAQALLWPNPLPLSNAAMIVSDAADFASDIRVVGQGDDKFNRFPSRSSNILLIISLNISIRSTTAALVIPLDWAARAAAWAVEVTPIGTDPDEPDPEATVVKSVCC